MLWKPTPLLRLPLRLLSWTGCLLVLIVGTGASTRLSADDEGFVDLLSSDLDAWRGYRHSQVPGAWKFADGVLSFDPARAEGFEGEQRAARGDLITKEQYQDFELRLEWKVGPAGNSGIFFHVSEDQPATYNTGPEMQILDNAGHRDGKDPLTSAGANYALHAPSRDVTRPVGEFNEVRLRVEGPRVRQWLNGVLVVEYQRWTPSWEERVAGSKFRAMPGYGKNRKGHVALQDHGDPVWFRNVEIKNLE